MQLARLPRFVCLGKTKQNILSFLDCKFVSQRTQTYHIQRCKAALTLKSSSRASNRCVSFSNSRRLFLSTTASVSPKTTTCFRKMGELSDDHQSTAEHWNIHTVDVSLRPRWLRHGSLLWIVVHLTTSHGHYGGEAVHTTCCSSTMKRERTLLEDRSP